MKDFNACARRRRRSGDRHLQFQLALDALAIAQRERKRHRAAGSQWLLQVHQHHVIAAGLEFHGLACRQIELGNGSHAHHVAVHLHLMHFGRSRHRRGNADQLHRLSSRDLHERARALLARHRAAHPGALDLGHRLGLGIVAGRQHLQQRRRRLQACSRASLGRRLRPVQAGLAATLQHLEPHRSGGRGQASCQGELAALAVRQGGFLGGSGPRCRPALHRDVPARLGQGPGRLEAGRDAHGHCGGGSAVATVLDSQHGLVRAANLGNGLLQRDMGRSSCGQGCEKAKGDQGVGCCFHRSN